MSHEFMSHYGNPLQYPCLENPMGGGAWWATVHGVAKSQTQLSDFTFTFHFHALEKEMAIHSSVLAWRIPGMAEPSGLPSMGSHRVGHDWSDLAAAACSFCTPFMENFYHKLVFNCVRNFFCIYWDYTVFIVSVCCGVWNWLICRYWKILASLE